MVSARLVKCCCCLSAVLLLAISLSAQSQPPRPVRVLMLYGHDAHAPGVIAFTDQLREVLRTEGPPQLELYNELLDLIRFPERERWPGLASFISDKYRGLELAAIVTEGSGALQFATEMLTDLFPGVPIVYGGAFESEVDFDALPAHVTGTSQPVAFAGTFRLARSLQPDAERVVIVGGLAPSDSLLLSAAVRDITPLMGGLDLVVLQDWSFNSLLGTLRQLSPRTIGILTQFTKDQLGWEFIPGDVVASIASASSAPLYGIALNWTGKGVVGGAVGGFGESGARTAQLLVRVLSRAPGEPMPAREAADARTVVDWLQLERWGMSESRLPPGTEVLFRPPTLWERYWPMILAALGIIVGQSMLIVLLLLERRRRIRAQRLADESRAQVTHMARVAAVGELAATVTHEIRQPLSAILANAEAGSRVLARERPDLNEARESFRDIIGNDLRAARVLDNLMKLLRKETPTIADVDINDVCSRTIRLLESDAAMHGVRLRTALALELPVVRGDAVQLQQVVLNLAMNAVEAARTSARNQEVIVGTTAGTGTVEVFVSDSGPGLSPELQKRVFEPFFSTKSDGLGMGLAIVRSIVEHHDGQVLVESGYAGGAVFRVRLPTA